MTITVVGVDGGPLVPEALKALGAAKLVVGARRHLELHAPPEARRLELGPLEPALAVLDSVTADDGPAVVLAAGDPGFFGIVRTLRERGLRVAVLPGLSAVQRVLAKVGRPWDDVVVVSAHGRDLRRALNVCRARPAVAVFTDGVAGPAEIGAGLAGWRRTMVVAEHLGGSAEQVSTVDPEQAAQRTWTEPNLVLCLADPGLVPAMGWYAGGEPVPPAGGWALPEEDFAHREGLVTTAEVRALAMARLAPRPGTLIWDVGAGPGAVGVECARMGAAVLTVERNPVQSMRIEANAASYGVEVRTVEGEAPGVLAGLPAPDAVFVGGGGLDVITACAAAGAQRVVVALTALDRVPESRDALRDAGYSVDGCLLTASRLQTRPDGASQLVGTNPVMLLWGNRK